MANFEQSELQRLVYPAIHSVYSFREPRIIPLGLARPEIPFLVIPTVSANPIFSPAKEGERLIPGVNAVHVKDKKIGKEGWYFLHEKVGQGGMGAVFKGEKLQGKTRDEKTKSHGMPETLIFKQVISDVEEALVTPDAIEPFVSTWRKKAGRHATVSGLKEYIFDNIYNKSLEKLLRGSLSTKITIDDIQKSLRHFATIYGSEYREEITKRVKGFAREWELLNFLQERKVKGVARNYGDFMIIPSPSAPNLSDYYFTQFVAPGKSIKQIMHELNPDTTQTSYRKGLQKEVAVDIMMQALDRLAAVHSFGIVHRDFSHGNVIVDRKPDGEVEVTLVDFGVAAAEKGSVAYKHLQAKHAYQETDSELAWTPFFGAPEAKNRNLFAITRKSDIYSAGKLLYYLLTGEELKNDDDDKVFREHVSNSTILDPGMKKILLTATDPDYKKRYEARDMRNALSRYRLEIQPTTTRRTAISAA